MALCGEDHSRLISRINRIEGQVRGLKKMVQNDQDCMQVLKQIAATRGALRALGTMLLEDHLKGCVTAGIRDQSDASDLIDQVVEVFNKFSK